MSQLDLFQCQKLVKSLEDKLRRQEAALAETRAQVAAAKSMEALAAKAVKS